MKKIDLDLIEKLVFDVQKPARYTGGEHNRVVKEEALLRMAISYPDLYEVGMSNQGIKILYDIANSMEGVACERVFAVADDFERKARLMDVPLYTLETYTPLYELDLIGFNISHELLCTNVLQILDLGKVPLLRRDRGAGVPIVMAGGEAVSNTAPLEDFIDAFFIGDGEEGLPDILNAMKAAKAGNLPRSVVLDRLEEIGGVYVPSLHRRVYAGDALAGIEGKRVKKRVFRSPAPRDPERPPVPSIRVAQDRAVMEVARGCVNLCKFCHAGYYDLPCREYRPELLRDKILRVIDNTGYSEITLASLSLGDYRGLGELLGLILPDLTERGVSISFPSLRVDPETLPLVEMVSDLRRTSLTFAVESASEELRRMAHKRLSNADLLAIMEHVFRRGWRVFKLYFMIGLPGCGEHDEAGAILDLLEKIKRLPGGKREINVTVSPFVPKPHTPFQYEPQRDGAYLEETLQRIRKGAPRSVTVKNHNLRASLLEGVLSRGDERLGAVIHRSYLDGCRLDSWGENLRFDLWEKNLDALLPGWRNFLAGRAGDAVLPWSIIETGFEKLVSHKKERETQRMMPRRGAPGMKALAPDGGALGAFERKYGVKARLRVRFAKKGTAKFIPHIDFMEIIKKALRMARVPVSFTQGFNKRERISLGYPLPLGVESLAELCDIDLYEEFLPDESFLPLLGGLLPEGIEAVRARPVEGKESLMGATVAAEYRVTADGPGLLDAMERNLGSGREFSKETKGGEKKLESERVIREHSLEGGALRLVLPVGCEEAMRIDQVVLQLAGAPHGEWYRFRAVKVRQFRREGDSLAEIE